MGHAQNGVVGLKIGKLPEWKGIIPGREYDLLPIGPLIVQSPSEIVGVVSIADCSTHKKTSVFALGYPKDRI
jgi:hypothetical protein